MIARKTLLFGLLLIASGLALPEDDVRTLLVPGRNYFFRIAVPDAWKVTWAAATDKPQEGQRQVHVFDLARLVSGDKDASPSKFPTIQGFYYTDMVPTTARIRWERIAPGLSTELPRVDGLSAWTLIETVNFRTLTAYTQFGRDVLYIHLSAPNGTLYEQGKQDLFEMLKSYKEEVAERP